MTAPPTMRQGLRCGTRFHPCVQGVHHMGRRRDKGSPSGSRFHPCVQGVQREATPLQEFTLWYTLPPLCAGRPSYEATPRQGFTLWFRLPPLCAGRPHGSECSGPAAKHRDMAPHQWSCTSAALQGTQWHMVRASAKELQQGNVHGALPELPNCLCTAVCNLYAMQIKKVWSSTQAHTTCH